MDPKTSVIIPMYNESRYIGRCLDSLLSQSYKDFEVVLIDDGSTDHTIEIAQKYDVIILQQQHGGPGNARNRGAKKAKGDIFVFVDADMYFDHTYIENLIAPIIEGQEQGTTHGTEKIGNPENIRAKCRGLDRIPNPPKRSGVYRAISKDAFEKSGGYNNDRFAFEDDLGKKGGISALTIKDAICYHNNPENLKESFKHDKWIGESMVAKGMLGEYIKKYINVIIAIPILLIGIIISSIYYAINISFLIYIIIGLLVAALEIQASKRVEQEKERKYMWALPIVNITRGMGYLRGMTKYLFIKK